jgi:hypothetical protein
MINIHPWFKVLVAVFLGNRGLYCLDVTVDLKSAVKKYCSAMSRAQAAPGDYESIADGALALYS